MHAVWHASLWLCLTGLLVTRPLHAAPPAGTDPNSEIGRWFQSLQNNKGEICCSVADCRRPYAWRQSKRSVKAPAQAAAGVSRAGFQFHGKSSARRFAG